MPAAIRIVAPNTPPIHQWIEAEVVRVGSSPENEIQIAGVAAHVATIVYRDSGYELFNRTGVPLPLARGVVAPGASAAWQDRAELVLGGEVSLTLVRHENPAPLSIEPGQLLPDIDAPDKDRMRLRQRRKELLCFIVTATALFLTACLLKTRPAGDGELEYGRVMRLLSPAPPEVRAEFSDVCDWLRKASSVEQGGNPRAADEIYRYARDLLLRLKVSERSCTLRTELIQIVANRLAES